MVIDGQQGGHLIVRLCENQIDNIESVIQKYRKTQQEKAA